MNSRVFGCGTHAGYVWHIRHGEEICTFCREAANEYNTALRARHRKPRAPLAPVDWARCGTVQNHAAHRYRGESPCDACRKAYNQHRQDTRKSRARPGAVQGRPFGSLDSYKRRRASSPHDLDSAPIKS